MRNFHHLLGDRQHNGAKGAEVAEFPCLFPVLPCSWVSKFSVHTMYFLNLISWILPSKVGHVSKIAIIFSTTPTTQSAQNKKGIRLISVFVVLGIYILGEFTTFLATLFLLFLRLSESDFFHTFIILANSQLFWPHNLYPISQMMTAKAQRIRFLFTLVLEAFFSRYIWL